MWFIGFFIAAVSLACAVACMAQDAVDETPMRDALDRWHEFYHAELHKCETINPALGLAFDGYNMSANTRYSQLRYFDRKVCRLFAGITDGPTSSNFVWQVDQWTTNALPVHP